MATTRRTKSKTRARGAKAPTRGKKAGSLGSRSRKTTSAKARTEGRKRLTPGSAEDSTSRIPASKRPAKKAPARRKRPRTGTTPGGSPSTVLPAIRLGDADAVAVPPPPDELPQGGAVADTDGVVRDINGEIAENVMPLESLEPGADEEPFDPPADSNAGSPGADVEDPADDSYTEDADEK